MFREFEEDLKTVLNIKRLIKVMLGNGIKSFYADEKEVIIDVTEHGLVECVPMDKWKYERTTYYPFCEINADFQGMRVRCKVGNIEDFCKINGFEIQKKDSEAQENEG